MGLLLASAPVVRRKESKVSLSTLVAILDVDQLIAKVVAETGLSKRAVIEQAIRDRWGKVLLIGRVTE